MGGSMSQQKFKVGDRVVLDGWICTVEAFMYDSSKPYCLRRVLDGTTWRATERDVKALRDQPAITSDHAAPADAAAKRKGQPVMTGVFDYFPDAILALAEISRIGNEQHHPGAPLHWEKDKSADHADCCIRHMMDRGTLDTDGAPHSGKAAWRAIANFQTELENADPELAARRQAQRDAAAKGRR